MILKLKGVEAIESPYDLQPPIGLNLIFDTDSAPLNTLLESVNLFEIWYVILLGLGISIIFDFSKKLAMGIAITYWIFSVGVQVGLAAIGATMTRIS